MYHFLFPSTAMNFLKKHKRSVISRSLTWKEQRSLHGSISFFLKLQGWCHFRLLLLLLSHLSHVRLRATPQTAAHQAPPSLGFSRQEHWSGLPFPSPMHESEKWKWKVKVKSLSRARLLATPWTGAHQAPPSMGSSRQEYWSGVPLSCWNLIISSILWSV